MGYSLPHSRQRRHLRLGTESVLREVWRDVVDTNSTDPLNAAIKHGNSSNGGAFLVKETTAWARCLNALAHGSTARYTLPNRTRDVAPRTITSPIPPEYGVVSPTPRCRCRFLRERYKLMMQHCLDADSRFGVVLIKSGSEVGGPAISHSTGTVANIVSVNRAEGGRAFLSVTGETAFPHQGYNPVSPVYDGPGGAA